MKFPAQTKHPFRHPHVHRIQKQQRMSGLSKHSSMNKSAISFSSPSASGPSTHSRVTNSNNAHYEFKEGDKLGEYRLVRQLGDGTFGRVVEGERKGKHYAIKIIRPVQQYISSAHIEKDILKALGKRDPNDEQGIVRYRHSFYHGEHYCLVFQKLGSSLYDIIKKNNYRGFPLQMVQSFFKQILKTMAFLHRIGYTHTDLKPENILLKHGELVEHTRDEQPYYLPKQTIIKIIDFGGATLFNDTHSSLICTRQYRPPEVILQCSQWNELADVWSIGCIIVQLVTGDLLFPTHSDCEHLLMIEKNSGKFPQWMVNKTDSSNLRRLFRDGWISESEADRQLQHWQNIRGLRRSEDLLGQYANLKELVGLCLQIDPNKRINCATALRHPFFHEKMEGDGSE